MRPVFARGWLLLMFFLCSCAVLRGGAAGLEGDFSPESVRRAVAELGASPSVKDRLQAAELTQQYPLLLGDERFLQALERQISDADAEVRRFAFTTIKDVSYAANPSEPIPRRVALVNRLAAMLVAYLDGGEGDGLRGEALSALAEVRKSPYYLRK